MLRTASIIFASVLVAGLSGSAYAVDAGCGIPMGTATVTIAAPNLTTLNVREAPGGKVLAQIPEGSQVSVVGACGPKIAAGLVAKEQAATPGWCQISAPLTGCVAEEFLQAGAGEVPAPLDGAAGLVAPKQ